MSLFDRYDQNQAQSYLHNEYFPTTFQHRFEDLFPQSNYLSTSDDSFRIKGILPELVRQTMTKKTRSIDRSTNIFFFSRKITFRLIDYLHKRNQLDNPLSLIFAQSMIFSLKMSLIYLFLIRSDMEICF